jgi:hypothetical protein
LIGHSFIGRESKTPQTCALWRFAGTRITGRPEFPLQSLSISRIPITCNSPRRHKRYSKDIFAGKRDGTGSQHRVNQNRRGLADRLPHVFFGELQSVLIQPEHPLHAQCKTCLARYIERLSRDETLTAPFDQIKQKIPNHP